MKGYHYTSFYNWEKIKEQGILPAPIEHDNILALSSDSEGVWLFHDFQESESLFGMLVDRYVKFQDWVIVELEVDFNINDQIRPLEEGSSFKLTHDGGISGWNYHIKEPIYILKNKIEPKQIKLRRSFNVFPKGRNNESS